jgi:hypothetical protein
VGKLAILRGRAGSITVGDPLRDHVIPLLLGLTAEKADDDHGHVVATDSTSIAITSEAIVHHVLTDLVEILLSRDSSTDELDNSLRRLAIPYS